MIFFDVYNRMARNVVVHQIMTPETKFIRHMKGDSKDGVLDLMDKEVWDQTPVYDSDGIIRWYVEREDLRAGTMSTLESYLKQLKTEHIISAETPVVDTFREISVHRFLYVLEGNRIVGLVTYSDLDRRPVRTLLFTLLNELEGKLIELMNRENSSSEYWMGKLEKGQQDKVEYWYNKRKEQDRTLNKLECFTLAYLFKAATEDGVLVRHGIVLGQDEVERMVDMRDKVAHPGLDLIANFDDLDILIGNKELMVQTLRSLDSAS
jgi:hypothetical protein